MEYVLSLVWNTCRLLCNPYGGFPSPCGQSSEEDGLLLDVDLTHKDSLTYEDGLLIQDGFLMQECLPHAAWLLHEDGLNNEEILLMKDDILVKDTMLDGGSLGKSM